MCSDIVWDMSLQANREFISAFTLPLTALRYAHMEFE